MTWSRITEFNLDGIWWELGVGRYLLKKSVVYVAMHLMDVVLIVKCLVMIVR